MDRTLRDKVGPLAFRLALGLICLVHGFSKVRLSGGSAWHASLPAQWQMAIAWVELVGGLMVLLGMQCRYAAGALVLVMIGETILNYGWDLWQFPTREWETTLVHLLLAIGVAGIGGGEWILDLKFGGTGKTAKRRAPGLQPSME